MKNKKILAKIISTAVVFSQTGIVYAAQIGNFTDLANFVKNVMNAIIPIIFSAAVVWTLYAAFRMIQEEGDKKAEWRTSVIYGIVGIFVMTSIWGLVNILVGSLQLNNTPGQLPYIPIP